MPILTESVLHQADPEDLRALQRLHEAASDFHLAIFGAPPTGREGEETFTDLPPGKEPEHKVVLGFFESGALVGCAELLRGYPDPATAYIGLLLFAPSHQGQGHGRRALRRIFEIAAPWGCASIRLAVIASNPRAHAFWLREGFREVARKPYPGATGMAIVMERPNPVPSGEPSAGSFRIPAV